MLSVSEAEADADGDAGLGLAGEGLAGDGDAGLGLSGEGDSGLALGLAGEGDSGLALPLGLAGDGDSGLALGLAGDGDSGLALGLAGEGDAGLALGLSGLPLSDGDGLASSSRSAASKFSHTLALFSPPVCLMPVWRFPVIAESVALSISPPLRNPLMADPSACTLVVPGADKLVLLSNDV